MTAGVRSPDCPAQAVELGARWRQDGPVDFIRSTRPSSPEAGCGPQHPSQRPTHPHQQPFDTSHLGGRPPYGYKLVDAGPHPNHGRAAAGQRSHRLVPDDDTAPVVRRIFELYVAGSGLRSIAQTLTDDGVLSPSAHDPHRNPHRDPRGWAFSAVRAILLDFRIYAATSDQAKRRMLISSGVAGWGSVRRNCAVMSTRRSLVSMSATDG